MFSDDLRAFGEEESTAVTTQGQATTGYVSAWSNHVSRTLYSSFFAGKASLIIAKAELQAKTDKVEAQLHALGGFGIQDFIPKNLQKIPLGRNITLSNRFKMMLLVLMGMLIDGFFPYSPYTSDKFCLDTPSPP